MCCHGQEGVEKVWDQEGMRRMTRLTVKDAQGNWALKGVRWEDLREGKTITKEMWERLYGALWKLMEYEDTGLEPDEVEELNDFSRNQTGKIMKKIAEEQEKTRWIPVGERLPEEHPSIFANLKGTAAWNNAMFEKLSDEVDITIENEKGEVRTTHAHTIDGVWKNDFLRFYPGCRVIAWRPLPDPYRP